MGGTVRRAMKMGRILFWLTLWLAGLAYGDEWKEITVAGANPEARYYHTLVEMGGSVYLFGGIKADPPAGTRQMAGPVNDFWKFDGQNWIKIADNAPLWARYLHSAVVFNNKMYIFGGQSDNVTYLRDMWAYSPGTNHWQEVSQGSLKPDGRSDHSATVTTDGKMIIYGGKGSSGYADNSAWIFDFASETWTKKSPGPANLTCHTAVMIDSKMYVFGGKDQSGYSNDVVSYDPVADTWENIAVQGIDPAPRAHYSVVSEDGRYFTVFGGESTTSSSVTAFNDQWQFDTATNTWSKRSNMLKGITRTRVASVINHGARVDTKPREVSGLTGASVPDAVDGGQDSIRNSAATGSQAVHLLFGGMTMDGNTLTPTDAFWLHYTDSENKLCAATLSESLRLHQPYFTVGSSAFWYDLQYAIDPQFPPADIMFRLSGIGAEPSPVAYAGCKESTLTSSGETYVLHMPSLVLGGVGYWIDFQYVQTADGYVWFKLLNAGSA